MAAAVPQHVLITGPPGVGKSTLVRKVCDTLLGRHGVRVQGFYTEEVRTDLSRGHEAPRRGEEPRRGPGQRIGFDVVTFDGKRGPLARLKNAESVLSGPCHYVGKYQVDLKSFEALALPSMDVPSSATPPSLDVPLSTTPLVSAKPPSLNVATPLSLDVPISATPPMPLPAMPPSSTNKADCSTHLKDTTKDEGRMAIGDSTVPCFDATHGNATAEMTKIPVNKKLVVIDEVGKMELLSSAFVERVRELFDSTGLVLMATIPVSRPSQDHRGGLLHTIRHRKDCKLFEVNRSNRDLLVEKIVAFILQQLN